jgi:alpha-glucosidase (family GH31 glycosyl hydrolase)
MPLPPTPVFHPVANPDAVVSAKKVRFTVLTDRLIRLEYSPDERFEDRPSQAFWFRDQPLPSFDKSIHDTSVEIETEFLVLKYRVTPKGFTSKTLSITLKQTGTTWRYGERPKDNLKGTARTLDGDAGKTRLENGLISKSGWALIDDSKSLVFNDTGWLEPRRPPEAAGKPHGFIEMISPKPARRGDQDLYFFGYGMDYTACLRDFTRVSGPIPMIPRYILGNWWSRYWAYTQAELKSLMEEFRSHDVPLSVCIIDMDWHIIKTGNASNGWTGYTWNRELFPDPAGFIHWLHEQGLRNALNLHPAKGVYPHEEQYKAMAEWMGLDPTSQQPVPFDIADPHFMEGYFELLHHPFERAGIDFWWMDWQQGKKSEMEGLDPLWLLNHLHYNDLGRDGHKRPFVFSRWGGLGNHRYPIGFSGDTLIRWQALAYQPYFTATAANVAYGWWSHDIGGHMFRDGSPELYLRWVQFGVFSPIFRLHSTSKPNLDRRPWGKPERYFKAARHAMQLRHALIPYIYSMAWRAHRSGISLVAPMYYGSPQDDSAYAAKDQYYFGSELVVAPITEPVNPDSGLATKRVWLPPGEWYNFFTGRHFSGDGWHEITATLEDIPVFAKAGAIVPLAPLPAWGGLDNPAELDPHIFLGADNSFELYEDDSETTDYQNGCYAITRFSLEKDVFTIHPAIGDLSAIPAPRVYRIHIHGVNDQATHTVELSASESYSIKFDLL